MWIRHSSSHNLHLPRRLASLAHQHNMTNHSLHSIHFLFSYISLLFSSSSFFCTSGLRSCVSRLHRVSRYDVLPVLNTCCLLFKALNCQVNNQIIGNVWSVWKGLRSHNTSLFFTHILLLFPQLPHCFGKIIHVEGDKGNSGKHCLKSTLPMPPIVMLGQNIKLLLPNKDLIGIWWYENDFCSQVSGAHWAVVFLIRHKMFHCK